MADDAEYHSAAGSADEHRTNLDIALGDRGCVAVEAHRDGPATLRQGQGHDPGLRLVRVPPNPFVRSDDDWIPYGRLGDWLASRFENQVDCPIGDSGSVAVDLDLDR